jgi:RNA polymerase sigma-70 factor, ECF subfamily
MTLDPAILESCRRGDPRAFRRLVEAHQNSVHALCVALAGADGEDVAQETFLRVYKAIADFDPRGPATLRAWILCIARRLCQDRARRVSLKIEVPDDGADAPDPGADPETVIQLNRMQERLQRALAALPVEQRAVLVLREWDDLEYEEIAAVEGVPVGTVRSRLARAREALRAALAEPPSHHERDERVVRTR